MADAESSALFSAAVAVCIPIEGNSYLNVRKQMSSGNVGSDGIAA